jgi:hypothetical protein
MSLGKLEKKRIVSHSKMRRAVFKSSMNKLNLKEIQIGNYFGILRGACYGIRIHDYSSC